MRILGIDPGFEHCGWAILTFGVNAERHAGRFPTVTWESGVYDPDTFLERMRCDFQYWGKGYNPTEWVALEEYRLYGGVNQTGSDMPTSILIGRLQEICRGLGDHLVMQPTRIKGVAANWAADNLPNWRVGLTAGSALRQHELDARMHALWLYRSLVLRKAL